MAILLSAGNDLSGNWYTMTDNKIPRSSGYLSISVVQYTEVFTAPSTSDSAVGVVFMIDDTPSGGTNGTWTLTLQEDATGAFSGSESDVATGTLDMGTYQLPDGDGLGYIALSSSYQFTTLTSGGYRWKIQTSGATQNRLRQSSTSATNWCYVGFDDRIAVPGTNDTIFVVDTESIDSNVTLGNGVTGTGWVWTHACYILNGGELNFADDGSDYKITLEGSVYVGNGGQLGSGTAMSSGGSGTLEWSMGSYANGDFSLWTGIAGKINLVGVTKTINTMYSEGDGTTGTPLKTTTDIGIAIDDKIQCLATEDFEETENKFVKSGSHAAGWILADSVGGAESGFSNTHTTEAPILLLTRNLKICTDSTTKGFRIDDNKLNSQPDGYSLGDDSIWSYVHILNYYSTNFADCVRTGMVVDKLTNTSSSLDAVNQTNKIGRTHRYNIYTDTTVQNHSLASMYNTAAINSTEQDSWFTMGGTNSLSMGSGPMLFLDCTFWDGNYDNETYAAGFGRCSSAINLTFKGCRVDAWQGVSTLNVRGNITNCQMINCEFGTVLPSPKTFELYSADTYFFSVLYKNCVLNDTIVAAGTDLQGGLSGSFIKFHEYDETLNKHVVYENIGIHQSTGATLDDTTTRTSGNLAYRFYPQDIAAGIVNEFNIPCSANSDVKFFLWAKENSAFYGAHGSGCNLTMELYLPGSITADDTIDISTSVIGAADTWYAAQVEASWSESYDDFATVVLIAKGDTASAYAYVADYWDGYNNLTALRVWKDALPAAIMTLEEPVTITGIVASYIAETVTINADRYVTQLYNYLKGYNKNDKDWIEIMATTDGLTFTFEDNWILKTTSGNDLTATEGLTFVFGGTGYMELNGGYADGLTVDGDLYINGEMDITGMTITGDLYIDTGANSTLDFSNVTVTGDVWNDDASHTLTINASDESSMTAGDPGTGNGQTNIQNSVDLIITVQDSSLVVIENAQVGVFKSSDDSELMNEDTNVSGVATEAYNFTGDTDIRIWIRKASSGATKYKNFSTFGTITSSGYSLLVTMVEDPNNNATS